MRSRAYSIYVLLYFIAFRISILLIFRLANFLIVTWWREKWLCRSFRAETRWFSITARYCCKSSCVAPELRIFHSRVYTVVESAQWYYRGGGFYTRFDELFRHIQKKKRASDKTLERNSREFFSQLVSAIWMSEWLVKGYFSVPSDHRMLDEDPPWALKFPSDVRVMDHDTRTNEWTNGRARFVLCLTLQTRSISCRTRRRHCYDSRDNRRKNVRLVEKLPFQKAWWIAMKIFLISQQESREFA